MERSPVAAGHKGQEMARSPDVAGLKNGKCGAKSRESGIPWLSWDVKHRE